MKYIFLRSMIKLRRWFAKTYKSFFSWVLIALAVGIIVGFTDAALNFGLTWCANVRKEQPLIILTLPLCGLLIVAIYRSLGLKADKGTNLVITSIRDGDDMTWRNTVCIFAGTLLTHHGGGSAGREGAALQIGGSIGSQIGLLLKMDVQSHRLITMCGMSAGFAALFGTPVSAAFFSMEVISVGIMHYSALVLCVISAITGYGISSRLGVSKLSPVVPAENADILTYIKVALFAMLCGFLAIVFCYVLRESASIYSMYIESPYLKVMAGAGLVIALTFLVGTCDYNGAGTEIIVRAFSTRAGCCDFLLKLLFTALTLGAGYKGGEILPVFFVGAAFGSFAGPLLGLGTPLGASLGLTCLFCGVTNCPVTALLLSVELFGTDNLLLYLTACAVSYMLSGYIGLYSEQKILYSKIEPKFIDTKAGRH